MKHKIVAVITVVALVVLIVVGVNLAHTTSVKQHARQVQAYLAQKHIIQTRQDKVNAEYKRVNDQCHVLQTAYDAQAVAVQKKSPRPVCDLKVVE